MINLLTFGWVLLLLSLFIFSYTQIDLNLTFSSNPLYQSVQQQLIQLGYFQRTINGWIISSQFLLLNLFYLLIIFIVVKGKIKLKQVSVLIILTAVILGFSYNAFSHDIFNYIFDGKILAGFNLNPYQYKPLDFPADEWIRFMHWTHKPTSYGPLAVGISSLIYLVGAGKFILVYFLFKLLFALSFILSSWLIYKITRSATALVLFAFHPLILIDGILSPHMDLIMATLALLSIYFFLQQKTWKSNLFLVMSVAIKYSTLTFLPLMNNWIFNKLGRQRWLSLLQISAFAATILQVKYSGLLQNWYLIVPLSIFPLLVNQLKLKVLIIILLLMELPMRSYIKFIFTGEF